MAARVSQVEGQKDNPANFLLMHAMGPNVAGVIGSAVAAGVLLAMFGGLNPADVNMEDDKTMAQDLEITDTILRDAHQSPGCYAHEDSRRWIPAFEQLDKVGYWSLECWGGATFDVLPALPQRGPVGAPA